MTAALAGRFADEHPVVNTVLMVVFARPIGRANHLLEPRALRARGVADQERQDDDRRG